MKEDNKEHLLVNCSECGKNFDPFKKRGFLQFLSLILLTNTVIFLVILVLETLWLVKYGIKMTQ